MAVKLLWLMNLTAWIWTLIDINKNDFKNRGKTKWFVLVFILPFPAMGFYYYFGIRKKTKKPMRFLGSDWKTNNTIATK
jgi:Phospholipase_D-nuclease N-terminal